MNTQVNRELQDILKIIDDKDYFRSLPEHRKTVAVSVSAVALQALDLEYVPEAVISKEFEGRAICRSALAANDADCKILPHIPFQDVQKEGIERFLATTEPFIVYSFADMQNANMAQEAVQKEAYCIYLVPDNMLTKDLCKIALKSPNTDEKISHFVFGCFPELKSERLQNDENPRQSGAKMKF